MRRLNEDMVRDIGIHALGGGLAGATLNALHNNSMSYSHAITQGGIFGALGGLTLSLASQLVNRFLGKRERRVDVTEESLEELPDNLVEDIKALNLPEEFFSSPEWEEVEVYVREIVNNPDLAKDADTTPDKLIASFILISFAKWKRDHGSQTVNESVSLNEGWWDKIKDRIIKYGSKLADMQHFLVPPKENRSYFSDKADKVRNKLDKEGWSKEKEDGEDIIPHFTNNTIFTGIGDRIERTKSLQDFVDKHKKEIKAKKMTADQVKAWHDKLNGTGESTIISSNGGENTNTQQPSDQTIDQSQNSSQTEIPGKLSDEQIAYWNGINNRDNQTNNSIDNLDIETKLTDRELNAPNMKDEVAQAVVEPQSESFSGIVQGWLL